MNNPEQLVEDTVYLTVSEYAKHFNISENTVRTRIGRSKLRTVRTERDGRDTICIPVSYNDLHSNVAVNDPEQPETVQRAIQNEPVNYPERSSELLAFMKETFATVQNYTGQLIELSRDNERYKLLTDGKTQQVKELERHIESLKQEIFEKDAKIKELAAQLDLQQKKGWKLWGK